ncbi:hypothetical protein [Brevundimonas subvibrioides]|uniref:Uncharacterized protein n=1 Tax=Brevundimonas subvibrioides (strain ATCC 15264 / DSM 4735 / LMG 14903 / NBRC 16000 / CB 81) TaxID=633149 RepID=D9QI84_BRESC|nr:hypothetical protein [Brevundimonas subvibrioides]ADK99386.1 conserved hypothetical protein [Brevundimonas subvibrioides ATCC 15264]
MGGAFALDFSAVIQTANLAGPISPAFGLLLAESLPEVERAIVASLRKDEE